MPTEDTIHPGYTTGAIPKYTTIFLDDMKPTGILIGGYILFTTQQYLFPFGLIVTSYSLKFTSAKAVFSNFFPCGVNSSEQFHASSQCSPYLFPSY